MSAESGRSRVIAEGVILGLGWFMLVTVLSSFAGLYIAERSFEGNLSGLAGRVAAPG